MDLIEITDEAGAIIEARWLASAQAVHVQLRPKAADGYRESMARIFAQGARMVVAVSNTDVQGLAVWRVYENTALGRHLHVDDLVTAQGQRSAGVGAQILAWLERRARARGCTALTLESGTQRTQAHRFYFRQEMSISGFSFRKELQSK
jgi:GNAT superfamily N-acetyltransferase